MNGRATYRLRPWGPPQQSAHRQCVFFSLISFDVGAFPTLPRAKPDDTAAERRSIPVPEMRWRSIKWGTSCVISSMHQACPAAQKNTSSLTNATLASRKTSVRRDSIQRSLSSILQGKSDIAACDANLDSGTPTASARGCMAQKGYVLVRRDQAEDADCARQGRVEVVTHPDSRINPAMKQYARLRCRTNSPGTLFRPMIRTPGRRRHRQPISISPCRRGRAPKTKSIECCQSCGRYRSL